VALATLTATPNAASAAQASDPMVPPAGCAMQYHGGPVISHVQVVPVFWTGNVDPGVQGWAAGYLRALVDSAFLDALSEYGTVGFSGGTNQSIGRGSATQSYTITPPTAASPLEPSEIVDEIGHQLEGGHLPKPTVDRGGYTNTVYVVFFPKEVSLAQSDGSLTDATTCSFCGYHGSGYVGSDPTRNLVSVTVIPDLTAGSPCAGRCGACDPDDPGCGDFSADFETTVSHELAESITDVTFTAWYGNSGCGGEIGDACRAVGVGAGVFDTGAVPGTSPTVYAQYLWSNQNGVCEISNPNVGPQPGPPECTSDADSPDCAPFPGPACSLSMDTCDPTQSGPDSGAVNDAAGGTDGAGDDAEPDASPDDGRTADAGPDSDGGASAGWAGEPWREAGATTYGGGSSDNQGWQVTVVESSNACAMTAAPSPDPVAWGGALLGLAALGRVRRKREARQKETPQRDEIRSMRLARPPCLASRCAAKCSESGS